MTEAEWLTSKIPSAMLMALIQPDTLNEFLRKWKSEKPAKARQFDRKLRLFACACVRHVWHLLEDERSRTAVEVSELYAGGMASPEELDAAGDDADAADSELWRTGGLEAIESAREEDPGAKERPDSSVCGETRAERGCQAARAATALTSRKVGIGPGTDEVFDSAWAAAGMASWRTSQAIAGVAQLRAWEASIETGEGTGGFPYEEPWQSDLLRCVFGNPFRPVSLDPAWLTPDAVMLAHAIDEGHSFDLMMYLGDALEEAGCGDLAVLEHCREAGAHARGCWVIDAVRRVG